MNGYFINALIHSCTENQLCPDFKISVCLNSPNSENQVIEYVLISLANICPMANEPVQKAIIY